MFGLIVFLILVIVGQQLFFFYHSQVLVNKIMSRDYAGYQAVANSANIENKVQPQSTDLDMPEDLRSLSGMG